MPERDRTTKSFGNTVSGFEFKIKKEDFDSQFDGIIKKILDNLEEYQSWFWYQKWLGISDFRTEGVSLG